MFVGLKGVLDEKESVLEEEGLLDGVVEGRGLEEGVVETAGVGEGVGEAVEGNG